MAAGRQAHSEDGVAGPDQGLHDALVRLRSRVRLDIGELAAEEALRAVDREGFGDVHVLAASVVATPGVAFRVLVRHDRALRLEDGAGDEVLRGDEFDLVPLAPEFVLRRAGDVRIALGKRGGEECGVRPVSLHG